MHHRFDDSPDYDDMDMDQRTRMLGRGGRIILLGDGTEILTGRGDDDDVDMDERGDTEEDSDTKDLEELLRNKNSTVSIGDYSPDANGTDRSERGETPAPTSSDVSKKVDESKQRQASADPVPTDEPKPLADSASTK